MKRLLALMLAMLMVLGLAAGCGEKEGASNEGDEGKTNETPKDPNKKDLNVWSFNDEIPNAIKRYQEMYPDSVVNNFNIVATIATDHTGEYEAAIEPALEAQGSNAPDLYAVEQAFVLKFTKGLYSSFAATYEELGIENLSQKIKDAQLAQYAVDAGTRDGSVVGLRFQETGSCVIYRRSIAEEVWGTSDPAEIAKKVGPGWDKFTEAAAEVKAKGYAMIHGDEDLWQAMRDSATNGWVNGNKLVIDPVRDSYFDISKTFYDNDYIVGDGAWNESWYAAMGGTTTPPVFCFLGPAWLINYTINDNALDGVSFGDWAVTTSPVAWAWGGTWVLGNNNLEGEKKEAVREIIEWITLDTSNTGFQYHFANGTLFKDSKLFPDKAKQVTEGTAGKDAVASKVVMEKSVGDIAVVDGQNIFEYFLPAGQNARSSHWNEHDRALNGEFQQQCRMYYTGEKTREEAIADFKTWANDTLGLDID
ncbi:MAG: carbohydrate ABC transporter substrate-binding protein [Oscillospiraceae bacterium]|nr:carbohydrate ABC transporter substrate-binding protein [Oscillospiraceae bacterium]